MKKIWVFKNVDCMNDSDDMPMSFWTCVPKAFTLCDVIPVALYKNLPQRHLEVDYVWKVSRYLAITLSSTQSPYIWILEVCTSLYRVLFPGKYEVMILHLISNFLFFLVLKWEIP